jgi:hypothetical protein
MIVLAPLIGEIGTPIGISPQAAWLNRRLEAGARFLLFWPVP